MVGRPISSQPKDEGQIESRTRKLKDRVLFAKPRVWAGRAQVVTSTYKQLESEPVIMKRARVLERVLYEIPIHIAEGELIVGCRSPWPRAGVVFPEASIHWIEEELDSFPTRRGDRFLIDENTKEILRQEIFPYWKGRTVYDRALAVMPEQTKKAREAGAFVCDNQLLNGEGHIIPNHEKVFYQGLEGIRAMVEEKLAGLDSSDPENLKKRLFYEAAIIVLKAAVAFGRRYARKAKELAEREKNEQRRRELETIAQVCTWVPGNPARTFQEALQSLWFIELISQLESNGDSVSIGRFDQYVHPFYKRDIEQGRLTRDKALELIKCLWIKFNEVVEFFHADCAKTFGGFPMGYTVTLGGQDEWGRDATNELSFMCLEATEDVRLPQANLAVRLHSGTPVDFLRKTCEVIRLGLGMPQLFNDEVIIPMLLNREATLPEARNYADIGCVEITIPGRTRGWTDPALVNLPKILELALNDGVCRLSGRTVGIRTGRPESFMSFKDLLEAYKKQMSYFIHHMVTAVNAIDFTHAELLPTPFLSTLIDDCIERGKDISWGGARYNFTGPQGVGIPNVADSLAATKKLVFEEKQLSIEELSEALDADFEGRESLRQILLNQAPKYGNDIDYVDDLAAEVARFYCQEIEKYRNPRNGQFQPGLYTISAHIPLGEMVGATPDGRKARRPLADGGLSPVQGMDKAGPTAVLRSVSKIDHTPASNGTLLNLKFSPAVLEGESGLAKLASFLRTFVSLKVLHCQFNVISANTLRKAQRNPEKYQSLVVRVAGYSALFATLDKELQDDIIRRTEHVL